uniref:Uncharacterized protein n=1 Tax=Aegilops tauschii TaxID=37682 RepID=N1QR45_AEGTA
MADGSPSGFLAVEPCSASALHPLAQDVFRGRQLPRFGFVAGVNYARRAAMGRTHVAEQMGYEDA